MVINKKSIYKLLGIIFMSIAIIGLFLPIIPTVPFILVSAYFFYHSSPKLFIYLLNHKYLGLPLYLFLKYRSIELRSKFISLILLWTSGSITMYFLKLPVVKIILFIIFVIVTIHILSFPTLSLKDKEYAKIIYNNRFKKIL